LTLASHLTSGKQFATFRVIHILHNCPGKSFSLPVVSNTLRGKMFRKTKRKRGSGERPQNKPSLSSILSDRPQCGWRIARILHRFARVRQRQILFHQAPQLFRHSYPVGL